MPMILLIIIKLKHIGYGSLLNISEVINNHIICIIDYHKKIWSSLIIYSIT